MYDWSCSCSKIVCISMYSTSTLSRILAASQELVRKRSITLVLISKGCGLGRLGGRRVHETLKRYNHQQQQQQSDGT